MILFGTGEDEVITLVGAAITTDPANFRAAYARCAISAGSGPWQHRFFGKLAAYLAAQPADDKDFWYGFRFRGGGGFLTQMDMLFMYDEAEKPFMRLKSVDSVSGATLATSPDGAAWTNFPGSATGQPFGEPAEWTFRVKKHVTLGRVEWYINGGLWYKTPNFDTTGLISGSPNRVLGYAPNSNGVGMYSEIMATSADDPRVGLTLHTLPPTADGDFAGWAGDWTRIAEVVKNASTVISTASDDTDSSFVNAGVGSLADGTVIRAIIHSGEYRTSEGAPQHVQPGLVLGGVAYLGDEYLADLTPTPVQHIWEASPATDDPLTEGEGNAVQMLVRSRP